jgi:hypothetical protein
LDELNPDLKGKLLLSQFLAELPQTYPVVNERDTPMQFMVRNGVPVQV